MLFHYTVKFSHLLVIALQYFGMTICLVGNVVYLLVDFNEIYSNDSSTLLFV